MQLALPPQYANYDAVFHAVSLLIALSIYWRLVPLPGLISWLILAASVLSLRAYTNRHYPDPNSSATTSQWLTLAAGLHGVLWGLAGYWCCARLTAMQQLPGVLLIASVTAWSLVALAHHWPAFVTFTLGALMPVGVGQLLYNDAMPFGSAAALLLYLVIILFLGRSIQRAKDHSRRLRQSNDRLVTELRQQREEAKSAQTLAEAANISKSKFLAAASHDLRQPLHAMGLLLHALENSLQDPESLAIIRQLDNSQQSMEKLFSALLDVSRLDAGVVEVNRHVFAIEQVLERLKDEFQPLAQARKLRFEVSSTPALVRSDPLLLSRILRNLITNAIVHTRQGGVSISCGPRPTAIEISICDTGPGIPQHELGNIFSEFHQLQNPERDHDKGLGLGLAIVRRLCALLGHDLGLESKPGEGTTFSLLVERVSPTTEKIYAINPPVPLHPGLLAGTSVLVVDDDIRITAAMKELLARWGITVKTAFNLEQAALLLGNGFAPDLAICDYRLRENLTGVQVLQRINAIMGRKVAGLLITGDTAPERIKDAHISGYALMHKPVNPAKLRNALAQLLSKRGIDS